MRSNEAWLCQGDVFATLPFVLAKTNDRGVIVESKGEGAALLLNDDCILDKRSNGRPALKRLNFAPLRLMADQRYSPEKERQLREGELNPPDPIYVDLGEDGEAVALLSETYAIPASYFGLTSVEDTTDAEDSFRLCISKTYRDTRTHAMELHEVRLLQEKLALFWTGSQLEPVCTICWSTCREVEDSWEHLEQDASHQVELTHSHKVLLGIG